MILEDRCCGTASVGLTALAGKRVQPPCGFMGGKQRWASHIADLCTRREPVDRLVLVDGGPWGQVWSVLSTVEGRADVAFLLERWAASDPKWLEGDAVPVPGLWRWLVARPPFEDPAHRAAQYLWLQARSAGCIPVWWDGSRWASPSGARTAGNRRDRAPGVAYEMGPGFTMGGLAAKLTEAAHERQGGLPERLGFAAEKMPGSSSRAVGAAHDSAASYGLMGRISRPAYESTLILDHPVREQGWSGRSRGVTTPATVAKRVRALDAIDWTRVEVRHGDVRDGDPERGSVVYLDPPYRNCPRYALILTRDEVLDLGQRWADCGARVLISEADPLPIGGWYDHRLLARRREFVTSNAPFHLAQLELVKEKSRTGLRA